MSGDSSSVPARMRAWRVHEYGPPQHALRDESVAVPAPGPEELLVRVEGLALNLNDLERVSGGNMMVVPEFPYSPGMEVCGTVVAAGDGATGRIGERVAATTLMAIGGFAEYALCPSASSFVMPESIAMPEAAAVLFPFHLAWLGLIERAELQVGETVLIHAAAGGSGSAAVQLAKDVGATVIATAGSAAKVQRCYDLGADVALDYRAEGFDLTAEVLAATSGRGVDVVFDNVGQAVFDASLNALAYNGRYVMMGFASNKEVADEPFVVPRALALSNARLCGVMLNYQSDDMVAMLKTAMGWNVLPAELGQRVHAEVVERIVAGRVAPVIDRCVGFSELPQALDALANRDTVGRVVVSITD